ncbi:MAG: hypothetical protein J6W86_04805 [Bacteroidales bacterium]|nr:hypothetical protein [Bacteroidales bacterium]
MKRFMLRHILPVAGAALLISGCGVPQAMTFDVEVMTPKAFVLDLDEQNAAVVATYAKDKKDSVRVSCVANGAATYLEAKNALEEGSVGAYTIPGGEYTGTQDKEYLEQLMLATGSQLLVILDDLKLNDFKLSREYNGLVGTGTFLTLRGKTAMTIYDAILDTTLFQKYISDSIIFKIPYEESLSEASVRGFIAANDSIIMTAFGQKLADHICNSWIEEEWMLIDYPDDSAWHAAYNNAMDFKWEEAIKAWLPMTEDKKAEKASYAAFNIAVACQMLGEADLALDWARFSKEKYFFREVQQLILYLENPRKP